MLCTASTTNRARTSSRSSPAPSQTTRSKCGCPAGTRLRDLYHADAALERATCNYGLNPDYAFIAGLHGMRVAAIDDTGEVRAIERTDHPFFMATLFQPQLSTSKAAPHPIWLGFIDALNQP